MTRVVTARAMVPVMKSSGASGGIGIDEEHNKK
jgi:hypothetical protein